MATATLKRPLASVHTLADLLDRLGNVPLDRIRFQPLPGTATERDVAALRAGPERRLCELVDGVLVEKTMGANESRLAMLVGHYLLSFMEQHGLGEVLGADGIIKLWPGRVRIPDVAFFPWDRLPNGEFPTQPVPAIVPDLAIEVLSPSNTPREMALKLEDYFKSGVRLAWLIDPPTATADVYTSPTDVHHLGKNGVLDGSDVLPGFKLPLKQLFAKTRKKRS